MSKLSEELRRIDNAILTLQEEREEAIGSAPQTFEDIASERPFTVGGNTRYFIVGGDGRLLSIYGFAQRPAAFRGIRLRPGRYIWDTRENKVYDQDENVVHDRSQS